MIKAYFMPAWGDSPEVILDTLKLQTPSNSGQWKDLIGVSNIADADCFIIQDYTDKEHIKFLESKNMLDKAFYFAREVPGGGPMEEYEGIKKFSYLDKNSYLYTKWAYPRSISGGTGQTYDDLVNFEAPNKTKSLICVQSNKMFLEGHRVRVKFIREFCEYTPDDLDLFGSIMKNPYFTALPSCNNAPKMVDDDKFKTMQEYKYCLAFDNGQYENYFGTQFTDAILSWTVPIYWGAPNIADFFPEGSYISFDARNYDEIDRILEVIEDESDYQSRLPALREARELILNKYNAWDTIHEAITTGKNTWGSK